MTMSEPMRIQMAEHTVQHAGLPEGEAGADDEHEVADQVEVDEAHDDVRRGGTRG